MELLRKLSNLEIADYLSMLLGGGTYVNALKALNIPIWIVSAIASTENWQDVALLKAGIITKADLRFRDGEKLEGVTKDSLPEYFIKRYAKLYNKHEIRLCPDGACEFKYNGRRIRLHGREAIYSTSDIFFAEAYGLVSCAGKEVVDVGANIGDTAIYFGLRGANHVHAYEPSPYAFRLAAKNIKESGLGKKISLINCGLGGSTKSLVLEKNDETFGGSDLKVVARGQKVKIITLDHAVANLPSGRRAVLKMDCEGYEYEILGACKNETLQRFDEIVLEYHYGSREIASRLARAGFEVKRLSRTSFVFNECATDRLMFIGTLYAKNKMVQSSKISGGLK